MLWSFFVLNEARREVIVCFVDIGQFHQYQQNKESLNSNGQLFHKYQQNKESLKSNGQQFHKYQQNKENLNSNKITINI
jgi:hypothetical protein